MNMKQFYRYVFVFLLSVSVFTGCGSDNGGGEFVSTKIVGWGKVPKKPKNLSYEEAKISISNSTKAYVDILNEFESTKDIQKAINGLKKNSNIVAVTVRTSELEIFLKTGNSFVIYLDSHFKQDSKKQINQKINKINNWNILEKIVPSAGTKKALILSGFQNEFNEDTELCKLKSSLQSSGYKIDFITDKAMCNKKASNFSDKNILSYFEKLNTYDIIYINTHGGENSLNTGIPVGVAKKIKDNWSIDSEYSLSKEFINFKTKKGVSLGIAGESIDKNETKKYLQLSLESDFFNNFENNKFKNSMIIVDACHSAEYKNNFPDKAIKNGVAVYIGYDNTISHYTTKEFVNPLIERMSKIDTSLKSAIQIKPILPLHWNKFEEKVCNSFIGIKYNCVNKYKDVYVKIYKSDDLKKDSEGFVLNPKFTVKNQSFTLNGVKQTITLKVLGATGSYLNYTIKTNPTHGKLTGTAPKLVYTPNSGYGGGDGFTFTVKSGTQVREGTVDIWVISDTSDKDTDGIPDVWELQYSDKMDMDKFDSYEDADGDGISNIQEFLDGTDPTAKTDFKPFVLDILNITEKTVKFQWNSRSGGTLYKIYISKKSIKTDDEAELEKLGQTEFALPFGEEHSQNEVVHIETGKYILNGKKVSFLPKTKYYAKLVAYGATAGDSPYHLILNIADERTFQLKVIKRLPAPINLRAISTDKSITLKWNKLTDVSAYKICMSESTISDGSKCTENGGKLIGVTATLKTISEGLKKDTTYYFRVRGIKSGFEALWSDEVKTKLKEQTLVNPGTVKGSVIDAVTNKVVSANIVVSTEEGEEVKTLTTDSDGKYTLSLSEGNYIFSVKATGYISELMTVTVKHKETTVVSSLRQIPNSAKGDGVAKGKIINALSGENLASVTLKARKGINSKKGTVVATEYSDGDGEFSFDLEAGNYTVEATADGYISIYFELLVIGKETTAKQNASMTPNIQSGEVRVILSWGNKPGDLDSHINTPTIDGYWYHVYWEKRGSQYYAPYTKLDVDRSDFANSSSGTTSRSGPETITLYKSKTGTYHYYVFNFSEGTSKGRSSSIQGSLVNSRATVKVYGSTGLIKTFTVPNGGVGNYWDVFTYDGGTGKITTVNTITNSKPN